VRILCESRIAASAIDRLEATPDVTLEMLPVHDRVWSVPDALVSGAELLLCRWPPRNLRRIADLKVLHLCTVGYEHLRPLQLGDCALRICNARGVFDTGIAEWNLAMMINLARDVRQLVRNQEQAHWERGPRFQQEMRERVVGVWGYGGIGRETARLAKAFGMIVHVLTRSGIRPRANAYLLPGTGDPEGRLPDKAFTAGHEREFLSTLDFLVLALPLTQQSTGLIGEMELRALPRTAFLLNPARGPIVQEKALLRALEENWIAGAALDAHHAYPLPPKHPLWQMPNVIVTPHISGADSTPAFSARMGELLVQNVARYLRGQPLLNEISPEELREA
jgi:phosphoglycerate dehydrogenase-like enzyme